MEITPSVLEFKGSFTKSNTEYLTLKNTSNGSLAFKVKTTAPKLYCVRPNASVVGAGESIQISIILQGFSQPLPSDYKCKDKFLLVSLPCPDLEDVSKLSDYWPTLESKYKQQLVQKKLRVNYVITDDTDDETSPGSGRDQEIGGASSSGVGAGAGAGTGVGAVGAGAVGGGLGAAAAANAATTAAGRQSGGDSSAAYASGSSSAAHSNATYGGDSSGDGITSRSAASNGYPNGASQFSSQQTGGGNDAAAAAAAAGIGAAASQSSKSQPSKDYQQDLDASNAKIYNLSDKFDSNEKKYEEKDATTYSSPPPQSSRTSGEEPVNGISLPMAVVLIIVAFLAGWLIF